MIEPAAWITRRFTFDLPLGLFPEVLERLRGTPARAVDLADGVAEELCGREWKGKWSAKENLGHLADLSLLDEQRLDEFLAGASVLSAADPANLMTTTAGHNQAPIALLLERLRSYRLQLVRRLEELTEDDVVRTALHPRLQQPMRIMDWMYFVAEHDDHHLALARQAILHAIKSTQVESEASLC